LKYLASPSALAKRLRGPKHIYHLPLTEVASGTELAAPFGISALPVKCTPNMEAVRGGACEKYDNDKATAMF